MNESSQEKLQHVPTIVLNEKKSTAKVQTQYVPVMNDKSRIKFPHILPKQRYPIRPLTVVQKSS